MKTDALQKLNAYTAKPFKLTVKERIHVLLITATLLIKKTK